MSEFGPAFEYLMGLEKELSNHPRDPGGLTAWGISKRWHPEMFVNGLPTRSAAQTFFHTSYWNKSGAWRLEAQCLANELFESSVLCGLENGGSFMQQAYNLVRLGEWEALPVDGMVGQKSAAAINDMASARAEWRQALYWAANYYQAAYLVGCGQRDFVRGWFAERLK